ncbi:dehydrogenase reductase sdr family member 4 [Stylonychia lemnae]|uniref:Dehydrogenase reductase sdr family member 4 n=1 Tax=Stylonychia lemnae TaxID=5949 RepID=A0A078ASB0_STYLE|nr:dehydrogenase reductase sdr family member 4 [Stylonychia lemnae]|eukprot:CDW85350.1 dehydrogenase reductase sdr family member 4 [Stylonychia lemnae]
MNSISNQRFEGKVCVITGGTCGIGLALAERVISEGASVVVCSVGKDIKEQVENLRNKRVNKTAQRVEGLFVDVTSKQDRQNLVNLVEKEFGRIDVLFVNAGIAFQMYGQLNMPESTFDQLFAVNVKGAFYTIKDCLELLKKGKNPNILVTSSYSVPMPNKSVGVYGMTKAAMSNMVVWLAQELEPDNIRVNGINPGMVNTNMTPVKLRNITQKIPRIISEPHNVASIAAMITSDDGSFINGESHVIESKVLENYKI